MIASKKLLNDSKGTFKFIDIKKCIKTIPLLWILDICKCAKKTGSKE